MRVILGFENLRAIPLRPMRRSAWHDRKIAAVESMSPLRTNFDVPIGVSRVITAIGTDWYCVYQNLSV